MSLKTKIGVSFFISASIIAILCIFEFIIFVEIQQQIAYLQVADTIRSESLQIRRHEKNFFLYPSQSLREAEAIQTYIGRLNATFTEHGQLEKNGQIAKLKGLVDDYEKRLNNIRKLLEDARVSFRQLQEEHARYSDFFPLIRTSFYDQPFETAKLLSKAFSLPPGHSLIRNLENLADEIAALRKVGEDLISVSRELDKLAQEGVHKLISISRAAIIIFMFLFLISGIATLFLINRNVVNRLKLIIALVEGAGKGQFAQVKVPLSKWDNDEVGMLITEFNIMEKELLHRETEISRQNAELLQSKKLAAIGTLAAGVAHELNNPLNNIYLSVQVLKRMAGDNCPPSMQEIVEDIMTQSARVKHIVGELLEFARGKDPNFSNVEVRGLITKAYKSLGAIMNTEYTRFLVNSDSDEIFIWADQDQIEQIFINLFHNAVEAMSGTGTLAVVIESADSGVRIRISDTGSGIPPEAVDRIFEPFFTTKDKGTGLGLAIVFNIMMKHEGDIRVESEVGKGTSFILLLPKGRKGNVI